MITPLEIQNKEFKKGIRGYKEAEIDSFLDEIIVDYEKLYKENNEMKDKIAMLSDQIKYYNRLEETLQNTLVIAQSTAEEVKMSAKKESELIKKEAEEISKKIIDEAHEEVMKIQTSYEEIKAEMAVYKTRFKTLLESQLQTLDSYFDEIN